MAAGQKMGALEKALLAVGLETALKRLEAALADEANGGCLVKALAEAEKATGQPRKSLALGLGGLLALYLVLGHGAELLCNAIGMAYPAYASMKAIKSVEKDDDTQWLIYWTVFGVFSLVDFFSEIILSWFPIYWLVKALFLFWLWCPATMGAQRLHAEVLAPLMDKYGHLVFADANQAPPAPPAPEAPAS